MLVGFAGDPFAAEVFSQWLKDTDSRTPDIGNEQFDAICIADNGRVTFWNQSLAPMRVKADFFAIGSGGAAAMAAMYCGKSAVEAVKIACKVDPYTGGPVRSLKLRK